MPGRSLKNRAPGVFSPDNLRAFGGAGAENALALPGTPVVLTGKAGGSRAHGGFARSVANGAIGSGRAMGGDAATGKLTWPIRLAANYLRTAGERACAEQALALARTLAMPARGTGFARQAATFDQLEAFPVAPVPDPVQVG